MTVARLVVVFSISVGIASCGSPSAPSGAQVPDVRGTWRNAAPAPLWQWVLSYTADGSTQSTACDGELDITAQSASSFAGRFRIECSSWRSSGSIRDGAVSDAGAISFRLTAEDGPDPGLPPPWLNPSCRVTDPMRYDGSLMAGNLSVNRVQAMDCPSGRIQLTASFVGTRR
jgi:hypothetical protein